MTMEIIFADAADEQVKTENIEDETVVKNRGIVDTMDKVNVDTKLALAY